VDNIDAQAVLAFTKPAAYELRRLDASVWREQLEARYDEVEAAFEWFLGHDTADALALASTLAEFMRISGRATIARSWLDRALQAAPDDDPGWAKALYEGDCWPFRPRERPDDRLTLVMRPDPGWRCSPP
jgi:hypothetical protein